MALGTTASWPSPWMPDAELKGCSRVFLLARRTAWIISVCASGYGNSSQRGSRGQRHKRSQQRQHVLRQTSNGYGSRHDRYHRSHHDFHAVTHFLGQPLASEVRSAGLQTRVPLLCFWLRRSVLYRLFACDATTGCRAFTLVVRSIRLWSVSHVDVCRGSIGR